ncbi:MAG TPA: AIPR family protein [Pyrinomonadaceae bacterium]|jgi:hypothetical protein|nr:AIPR family protein [Pyrinomonadaceae bacterium]
MKTEILSKYRQSASELRQQLNVGKYKTQPPERAFIDWYVLVRFGKPSSFKLLDGKKDGGLDALIESDGIVHLIQSKYEVKPKVSLVTRNEIGAFENLARKFKDPSYQEEFDSWLDTVRPQLHATYKKVRQDAIKHSRNVRFIFVTSKRSEFYEGDLFEIEDIQNISALWDLYSEGFTPPTESILLTLDSAWYTSSGNVGTYVGIADVKDFIRLMERDENERLFAQNVRTNLHSKVNEGIRDTYEKEPDVFWLGNNGIYIVCKKVYVTGKVHRLTYPSIINGSQTLHSIAESKKKHSCKILVRILEMDVLGKPSLLDTVIRRTNTQNTMKLTNLFAHESVQLNIARFLDRYKIFYERREREWANEKKLTLVDYTPIKLKEVAQWLSTIHSQIGLGLARSRVASLFETENYNRIFSSFDQSFKSSAYTDLSSIVWSGLFIKNMLRHLSPQNRVFAKISHLLLVKFLYESIQQSRANEEEAIRMLEEHRFGQFYIPKPIIQSVKKVIRSFVEIQRKAQRQDVNLDFSNFFKRDELCNLAYRESCTPNIVAGFSKILTRLAERIE